MPPSNIKLQVWDHLFENKRLFFQGKIHAQGVVFTLKFTESKLIISWKWTVWRFRWLTSVDDVILNFEI